MKSLGLGYIGLDFASPPGDLTDVAPRDISPEQRDYWDFAHTMQVKDLVLVIAHHYPCALVRVVGTYNYIRDPEVELNVWFRHFRRVEVLGYYVDYEKKPTEWQKTIMTDTISPLHGTGGISYRLIEKWSASLNI